MDRYQRVNADLRRRGGRATGDDDRYDELIQTASQDLGYMVEAALGLVFDAIERAGLAQLEEGARKGTTKHLEWLPGALHGVRTMSGLVPGSSGRAVSAAAELAMRTGLVAVRDLREWLEDSRRNRATVAAPRGAARTKRRKPASPR